MMEARARSGAARCATVTVLAALLVLGAPGSWDATAGTATAQLAVASDPSGASVFVDGRWAGATPLELALAPGEHRLTVTKPGYLENSRRLMLEAGSRALNVRLTPGAQDSPTPADAAGDQGGGGFGGKALWIGLGALAAGAAIVALAGGEGNTAPVAAVSTDLEGIALLGATQVGFSASGSRDPDGDPLTYSWDFGDGSTAMGASVSHTYQQSGSFEVKLTVSDGKLSASASDRVNVRGLAGAWRGTFSGDFGSGIWNFFHNGSTISGTRGTSGATSPFNGSVENPRRVKASSPGNLPAGLCPFELEVETDSAVTAMTGTLRITGRGCGTSVRSASFVRL